MGVDSFPTSLMPEIFDMVRCPSKKLVTGALKNGITKVIKGSPRGSKLLTMPSTSYDLRLSRVCFTPTG